jgi:hypothetical protein
VGLIEREADLSVLAKADAVLARAWDLALSTGRDLKGVPGTWRMSRLAD